MQTAELTLKYELKVSSTEHAAIIAEDIMQFVQKYYGKNVHTSGYTLGMKSNGTPSN